MAWFRCMVGAGNALELIVTCAAAFAGQTITCIDGTSTLTATCPSSSPYEITFKLPNYGTWTVSGTTGGQTYSESIVVQPYDVELINKIDITVDVYSAANDTISYTGLDGQTHTITTDVNGHASAMITILATGSTFTFTSNVAKNPSNLSQNYSKSIGLTSSTTTVNVMPDGEVLYWYGYKGSNQQAISTTNGWSFVYGITAPTYDINDVAMMPQTGSSGTTSGIGKNNTIPSGKIVHGIAKATNLVSGNGIMIGSLSVKELSDNNFIDTALVDTTNTVTHITITTSQTAYVIMAGVYGRQGYGYAFWIE